MPTDSIHRSWLLIQHNIVLRLRDPGQLISYIVMPLVLMAVLQPLYVHAIEQGELQAVTGPLVMFSVFTLSIVGTSILVEREWRTWDRLRACRARRIELLLGKTVPILVTLIVQQTVLLLVGSLITGLALPPTAFLLVIAIFIWAFTLLLIGAALATTVRSLGELSMATDLGAITVSALGGTLVPVS